jgi:hypothetical protein
MICSVVCALLPAVQMITLKAAYGELFTAHALLQQCHNALCCRAE